MINAENGFRPEMVEKESIITRVGNAQPGDAGKAQSILVSYQRLFSPHCVAHR